jgi:hypothetical protein
LAIRAILHVVGEESVLGEIEAMPNPSDNFVVVTNPRRKDGKPLPTVNEDVSSVVFPWTRIAFIELFEESSQRESVVGFFRESDARRRS